MAVDSKGNRYPCTFNIPFGEGPARFNKQGGAPAPAPLVNDPPSRENPYGTGTLPPLPEHVVRMEEETRQLVKQLRNLATFMETKTYSDLPALEQELMAAQRHQMEGYAKTLSLRYFMALLER